MILQTEKIQDFFRYGSFNRIKKCVIEIFTDDI